MSGGTELATHYREVSRAIAAAGALAGHSVKLIAASKGQPIESVEDLYGFGHRDFGENYVQELVERAGHFEKLKLSGVRWHFIGHLQTNKIKSVVPFLASVHSVDSEKLAGELAKHWSAAKRTGSLPVFIEVNLDGEPTKHGVTPAQARELAQAVAALPALDLRGLMAIPAAGGSSAAFKRLRELELTCRPFTHGELSMGMSSDYQDAIREGATHVRVGTAIFGPRSG